MDEENWDASVHLIDISSLIHMSKPRFCPLGRFVQESHHLPFGTSPTRPVRLHSSVIVAPWKFRAECGAQVCDILRLLLLTHTQYISDQHPTGKQGVKLCCSPCGVVLNSNPTFPELFNPLCHCVIWQRCMPHASQSLWKHSCVLLHHTTSILIQECCPSLFCKHGPVGPHYPYESQCSTPCSRLTEYCCHWLH